MEPRLNLGRPERSTYGPTPVYSRAKITDAAVRIADAKGLEAATMRRIAAELGAGAMSLYRYVPSREDLIELMADQVMGEIDVKKMPSGDWRADLTRYAEGLRAMWMRHPWTAGVQRSLPSFGPNQLLLIERLMGVLDPFVPIDENLGLVALLNSYVEGTVREEISTALEVRRSGLSESEWMARSYPYIDRLVKSGGVSDLHQDRDGGAPAAPKPRRPVPARAPARPRLHHRGPPLNSGTTPPRGCEQRRVRHSGVRRSGGPVVAGRRLQRPPLSPHGPRPPGRSGGEPRGGPEAEGREVFRQRIRVTVDRWTTAPPCASRAARPCPARLAGDLAEAVSGDPVDAPPAI